MPSRAVRMLANSSSTKSIAAGLYPSRQLTGEALVGSSAAACLSCASSCTAAPAASSEGPTALQYTCSPMPVLPASKLGSERARMYV